MDYDSKLAELFIDLPEPRTLPAGVVHAATSGKLLWIEGLLPFAEGRLVAKGRVGVEVLLDTAQKAARAALVQGLSVLAEEGKGTLNRVRRIVRLTGEVASGPDFTEHEKVLAGASELLVNLFGKQGEHVRRAVGVASLPQGACVQLSLLVEMR